MFQSPSLRGSGRFTGTVTKPGPRRKSKFQSPSLRGSGRFWWRQRCWRWPPRSFQSPSLRGSGRFAWPGGPGSPPCPVSIPFIAGQWSLPGSRAPRREGWLRVSIPFIAGQWSLQRARHVDERTLVFQSPSLRGSGRFERAQRLQNQLDALFQSPSLRGSGRFRKAAERAKREAEFQSPSLRGSGRFEALARNRADAEKFQSPSLRGSGRFIWRGPRSGRRRMEVSIPFIAGQWSLPSPPRRGGRAVCSVSIPFIAGQWSLHSERTGRGLRRGGFQSPSLRGSGRFRSARLGGSARPLSFNPLHCGAVVASSRRFLSCALFRLAVSIPFIAGQWSLLPRTTPSSLFGVLLRKRRLPCDHIICTRLPF